jgi:hypothetical protein
VGRGLGAAPRRRTGRRRRLVAGRVGRRVAELRRREAEEVLGAVGAGPVGVAGGQGGVAV